MSYLLTCPVCGKRNGYEFRFGGEERGPRPDEKDLTPQSWLEWAHLRENVGGPQKEWWCHQQGCGLWFTTWRNTLTNHETPPEEGKS
jgi:sarcosine oxidase subunit delta